MRPLTDKTPKPLLPIAGKPLLQYHLERLVAAGISECVINHAHLGQQIVDYFGDGAQFGLRIRYSPEARALETGGGIYQALAHFGDEPFLVINGDVWSDFPLTPLLDTPVELAHLVLVANPAFNTDGDFALEENHRVAIKNASNQQTTYTFSGISVLSPELFKTCEPGAFPLAPLLRDAMRIDAVTGEVYSGAWFDVGTPERMADLESYLLGGAREARS